MTDVATLPPDLLEEIAQRNWGMSFDAYSKLTIQEQVQLAYDRGLGFAASGVSAIGHDGKPVTEQDTKIFRPDFGSKPSA